eukprot:4885591-Alexandrium_andersonii.AAC.1
MPRTIERHMPECRLHRNFLATVNKRLHVPQSPEAPKRGSAGARTTPPSRHPTPRPPGRSRGGGA